MGRWLAIATAVLVGSLIARFAYVEIMSRAANRALEQLAVTADRQLAERNAIERNRREQTKRARDLLRRCEEFQAATETIPGAYVREQRDAACAAYDDYVRNGVTPRRAP